MGRERTAIEAETGPNRRTILKVAERGTLATVGDAGCIGTENGDTVHTAGSGQAINNAGVVSHDEFQHRIGDVARPDGTTAPTVAEGAAALDNDEESNDEGAVTNCDFTNHGTVRGSVVERVTLEGFETGFTIGADELDERIDEY